MDRPRLLQCDIATRRPGRSASVFSITRAIASWRCRNLRRHRRLAPRPTPSWPVAGHSNLNPRGAWVATTVYMTNDLVTSLGSSWIAKRNNIGISLRRTHLLGKVHFKGRYRSCRRAAGAQGPPGPQGGTGRGPSGNGPQGPGRGLKGSKEHRDLQGQQRAAGCARTRAGYVPGPTTVPPANRPDWLDHNAGIETCR